ncbi:uncharacterized protein BX663DRAFT_498415, partial [Cokeromyces recurvatus]|uniref:uncharacterized protein n=1 Tax=Cokeromyces recurvatus TaxID=90255 RepID=UPI00221EECC3
MIYDFHSSSASSTVPTTASTSPYTYSFRFSAQEKKVLINNAPEKDEAHDIRILYSSNIMDSHSFINKTLITKDEDNDVSSIWTDDAALYLLPPTTEMLKLNLPLPPSNISFFEDKMELDTLASETTVNPTHLLSNQNKDDIYHKEENELQKVVLSSPSPSPSPSPSSTSSSLSSSLDTDESLMSTTIDSTKHQSSLLSMIGGVVHIQQKTANIRSSLYQSLRRKSFTNASVLSQNNNKTSSIPSVGQVFNYDIPFLAAAVKNKNSVEEGSSERPSISSTASQFLQHPSSLHEQKLSDYRPSSSSQAIITISDFFKGNYTRKKSFQQQQKEKEEEEEEEPNSNKIMIDTMPLNDNNDLNSSVVPSLSESLSSAISPRITSYLPKTSSEINHQRIVHHAAYLPSISPDKTSLYNTATTHLIETHSLNNNDQALSLEQQ